MIIACLNLTTTVRVLSHSLVYETSEAQIEIGGGVGAIFKPVYRADFAPVYAPVYMPLGTAYVRRKENGYSK